MPPFWPFKRSNKKEQVIDETPPAAIVYRKGQDVHTEKHSTTNERNESAYKDALALFGGGDTTVVASSNVADEYDGVTNEPTDETIQETVDFLIDTMKYYPDPFRNKINYSDKF